MIVWVVVHMGYGLDDSDTPVAVFDDELVAAREIYKKYGKDEKEYYIVSFELNKLEDN